MEKNLYKNRAKRKYSKPTKSQDNRIDTPKRRRRVSVDRDVEVVIVSNTIGNFYYENPRMNMAIDLEHINDEEYVTVGDLRTILNSNRRILEGFSILITEVLSDDYTLDDVLTFLGLNNKYDEFYSLSRKSDKKAEVNDIKDFLLKAPVSSFEKTMKKISGSLRERVIETAITMFKLKEFGDYNKMSIIEGYVNDEIFLDAKVSEVVEDIYI
ncbi:hypothetical protein [Bacillus atrophaeus]|uniref:hypothetical protein n=1 Tax=Bacillus atrophaeus TaxID=1452 RepID=UPI00227E66CE|nr:hypothetical protein [Bacillus atrophaeus]MCY7947022.1 hypothetical protein [Bacillus atrophaeus]MCY8097988.1 hypothetical protein [Bacillus atrophaeus]MCY9170066.1 hypothetical protein [Bacillus atrophaeus]MEC0740620.1 hypothetical protein [Bacillus atrophaeus]MEC0746944.1 hypothetical protein [Bacillus atrophaeus]